MILARKFTQAKDNDYESLAAAGGRLRAVLEATVEGDLPEEYAADRLAAYAESLIAVQRMDGSFSVSRSPDELDPDVKTDAHRFVTWVAAAFLNHLRNTFPEEAAGVPGLDQALNAALNSPVAGDLGFPESGPAEAVQQVEAVLVLASGGIPALLNGAPTGRIPLADGLGELAADFRRRLETGDTTLPGGIDYTLFFEKALADLES